MNITTDYRGPLAGLNVIDFGHYYAGPMAGMLLADQGANVIRIVKPGERELPGPQYRLLNRNKKLQELDLKTEEGRVQALSLIERADVLIENFRPGVMKRLGLDYASVKDKNPGLVYLSLPGFSSRDRERAPIQAWEGVIAAASGIFTEAHSTRQKLGFPPLYASVPLSSAYDGWGTVIETPLVDAGLSAFGGYDFWGAPGYPPPIRKVDANGIGPGHDILEKQKPNRYELEDSEEKRLEKVYRGMRTMFANAFHTCADGREILVWAYRNEKFSKTLGIDKPLKREVGEPYGSGWQASQFLLHLIRYNSHDRYKRI